jgi:hypothetical protein
MRMVQEAVDGAPDARALRQMPEEAKMIRVGDKTWINEKEMMGTYHGDVSGCLYVVMSDGSQVRVSEQFRKSVLELRK